MKIEQVLVGNIRVCTGYIDPAASCIGSDYEGSGEYIESEPFKENAVLLKIKNGGYVDLDLINSFLDRIRIKKNIKKDGYIIDELMMAVFPTSNSCLFVEKDSLKVYYDNTDQTNNISLHKLKKQTKLLKKSK